MTRLTLLVLSAAIAPYAFGQNAPTLKQLEALEQLEKANDELKKLDASFDAMIRRRKSDCIRAIGYEPFCACILKDLPVAWGFSDYIAITTRTREENEYAKMSAEYQSAYDKVAPIRDKCVQAINAKAKP